MYQLESLYAVGYYMWRKSVMVMEKENAIRYFSKQ